MANSSVKSTVARLTGSTYDSIAELKCVRISEQDQKNVTDYLNLKKTHAISGDIKMLKHVRISKEDQRKVKEVIEKKEKAPERRSK